MSDLQDTNTYHLLECIENYMNDFKQLRVTILLENGINGVKIHKAIITGATSGKGRISKSIYANNSLQLLLNCIAYIEGNLIYVEDNKFYKYIFK